MSHRLEESPRVITWTVQREVTVGYVNCNVCNKETPTPSSEELLRYAKWNAEREHGFLWPGAHDRDKWWPAAWSELRGPSVPGGANTLCDDCTKVVVELLDARRAAAAK